MDYTPFIDADIHHRIVPYNYLQQRITNTKTPVFYLILSNLCTPLFGSFAGFAFF